MKMIPAAALAALALAQAVPTQAATFLFSYQSSVGTISGTIEGVLQADKNTVAVQKVLDFVTFNGTGGIALPWLGTGDIIYGGTRAPTVTLDGSFVDFAACEFEFCDAGEAVIFYPDVIAFQPVVRTGPAFGNLMPDVTDPDAVEPELFNRAKWTLTETAASAVPEPGIWMMLIVGFALTGAAMRRPKVRVAFA